MNVIITNEQQAIIAGLDIDIIKSLNGEFEVDELISMFQNFYFGKMILDITAIKDYNNMQNLQKLSMSLEVDKIILLLPANNQICTSNTFLSQLISMGIYNFTTNLEGLQYLYSHPNTYRDVAHIHQLGQLEATGGEQNNGSGGSGSTTNTVYRNNRMIILGFKNVTEHAGATSLIYMLKKNLESHGLNAVAVELNKRDFQYFGEENMASTMPENLANELLKYKDADIALVDLNDSNQEEVCGEVLYLLEPSMIRLNKLMKRDRRVFEKLKGKKIILAQSLLNQTDINDFEYESKLKIFYNLPPLNDRVKNPELTNLLDKLGIIATKKTEGSDKSGGIFDIFKRNDN
ncbi:MAG: hypothetical protein RSB99_02070 [Bacilli bacterium]